VTVTTAATAMTTAAVALSPSAVFIASIMSGIAYIASAVPRFVCVEVVERLVPAVRHRPGVTMTGIVPVVDVTIEAARTVIPGARPNE
jgi:hypothetical protein